MKALTAFVVVALNGAATVAIVPDTGEDPWYRWVGQAGGGSGTAITPRSVIMAKHIGGSTYGVLGDTYYATSRIDHPTMDLTILNFDTDLPGWHKLGADAPIGASIAMVGWGRWGTVNDAGNGYDIWWWSGGKRIAAPNKLHEKWYIPDFGPSLIFWLNVNGDAAAVSGDSGGGIFIGDELVGVLSFAFNNSGGSLPNYGFASQNNGVPYHGTGAIDLTDPQVRQWVLDNVIPAPVCAPCDVNCDGSVNGFDVAPFVELLTVGGEVPCAPCSGDVNADGSLNGYDIEGFVLALNGGGC